MRLSTRTGLAAFAAAFLTLAAIATVFQGVSSRILLDRVDATLRARAETAPILAAIAERLAQSELSGTVDGARIRADGRTTEVGQLPTEALPDDIEPGWSTAGADGQPWRLYTIEVTDVPRVGDEALVQLAAPLGQTEAATRRLRRRSLFIGFLTALGAGLVGYLFGGLASRPLTALRRDTARLDDSAPDQWRVAPSYGSIEVDEVAASLNHSLSRLADETHRRGAALESARAFASAATHELRAPLQSALTNLNLAASGQLADDEHRAVLDRATAAVRQTASALAAVRTLAEAEFADQSWFTPVDLGELVEAAVADEIRRHDVAVEIVTLDTGPGSGPGPGPGSGPGPGPGSGSVAPGAPMLWAAGVQLAVANVVRNAVIHGRPNTAGTRAELVVRVGSTSVVVDDNGPGIAVEDRQRVIERFERSSGASGSGLGLTIARQVAVAHGGTVTIDDSPLGGARVTLTFAPGSAVRGHGQAGIEPGPPMA